MSRLLRRRLAFAVAAVALLAGGAAAALGASGGHPRKAVHARRAGRPSLLSVAAGYLGTSPTLLRAQLQSGKSLAQVAQASPGHSVSGLTAALLAARSTHLSQRITALVERTGATKPTSHTHTRPSARAAAASYLGLSRNRLRSQLHAGRSLAEIATATPGHSAAGLIDAIVAGITKRTSHEAAGHPTKSNQAARLAHIRERVSAVVARTHHASKNSH
jgi:hypothetical protein